MRTLERWEGAETLEDGREGPREGPANALSEEEKMQIIAISTSPKYCNESPAQIVPNLADEGIYVASESSFYRVLREHRMVNHRGKARAANHHRPTEIITDGPNAAWSWDITYLKSAVRGLFFYLYLIVDIWSRKIVGWDVHENEDGAHASALIREAAFAEGVEPETLILHSDNGGPMKGATMLATLQWLGIVPSFSRPHVSDDNPYSESLFRTLKYRPEYPDRPFESLDDARKWFEEFVRWYNHEHRHSGIRFVTPAQRHSGEDRNILRNREEVYRKAKERNPSRWSGNTRNWDPIHTVVLNPSSRKSSAPEDAMTA
jgi:transposase InsO family protein